MAQEALSPSCLLAASSSLKPRLAPQCHHFLSLAVREKREGRRGYSMQTSFIESSSRVASFSHDRLVAYFTVQSRILMWPYVAHVHFA